jgi:hypothetical protein
MAAPLELAVQQAKINIKPTETKRAILMITQVSVTDPDVGTSDLTPIYSSSFVYEPVHYRHPSTRYV